MFPTSASAELTIGHMIALARNIVQGTISLREGKWEKEKLMGTELNGKTLGVIGCGYIGKDVERLALALGHESHCQSKNASTTDLYP